MTAFKAWRVVINAILPLDMLMDIGVKMMVPTLQILAFNQQMPAPNTLI